MTQISLKNRIIRYLEKRKDLPEPWVASGDIQDLARMNGMYSPQNSGRRLRELQTDGIIEVEYRKNHAYYKFKII